MAITESDFLFNEVFGFFKKNGYESEFLEHLAAPIIGGEFQDCFVPADLLMKLIQQEEQRKAFDQIEQIILNVNVREYD